MQPNEEPEPGEDPEITAMKKIGAALAAMENDAEARTRVLRWAVEKYRVKALPALGRTQVQTFQDTIQTTETTPTAREFADFPDLFAATTPDTDAEKALVAGYWFQVLKGEAEIHGQQLNDVLKHVGHPIGNITDAMSSLKDRRPALVVQTRKSGTSRQARKKYKLTTEGVRAVEQMLAHAGAAQA